MLPHVLTLRRNIPPAHSAQAFAARNLYLLSAIESTLDALTSDTNLIAAIERSYDEIHQILMAVAQDVTSAERRLCIAPMEKASDMLSRIWCDARDCHDAARKDPQLRPDDGVIDAWQQFMDAVRNLHDKVETVRNWLEDVDAVAQPSESQIFDNVDDLMASLRSLKRIEHT